MIRIPEKIKKAVADNILLICFSLAYYGIIIFLSGYLNIWEDELYSLNTSSKTLSYTYHQSGFFELQPPFYFILLTVWRSISHSIIWARMLNVILIFISQILLYRFIIRIADKKRAILLSILFLLNPTIVYFLLEIRLPALIILLSMASALLFYNTYYCNNISYIKRILFIILAVTGLFTQHYFGFLLFANALILLFGGKKRSFWIYILDMIIPLCLVLLYVPQLLRSINIHTASVPVYTRTFLDFVNEVKILLSQITFGYFLPTDFINLGIWHWILRAIFISLFSFFLYQIYKSGTKKEFHGYSQFILVPLVIFIFFTFVDFQFGRHSVLLPKYTIVVFTPIFISIVIILKFVNLKYLNVFFILLFLVYLSQNITRYHDLYKNFDFRSLSHYIEQDEKKGQDIFIYPNIDSDILKIYYKGINEIYPIKEPFSFDKEYSTKNWLLTKQDIQEFNDKFKEYDLFYVIVVSNEFPEFVEFNNNLMSLLSNNYTIEKKEYFNKNIFLYRISAKI